MANLMKTSVRKVDMKEDGQWRSVMQWASTGEPLFQQHESPQHAGDGDSGEEEVKEVTDLQTPKPQRKTNKQR